MLSIIFPSRFKNNPDNNLLEFLRSIYNTTSTEQRKNIEVLIKFDSDDDLVPDEFKIASLKEQYIISTRQYCQVATIEGIKVRSFFYERGEGRSDINNVLSYLGTLVNPCSELIMNAADDFLFVTDSWYKELFNKYNFAKKRNGGYIIFGEASTVTNYSYSAKPHTFLDLPDFNQLISYNAGVNSSALNKYIGEYCPIFSKKIFNVLSGQFWMPSIDAYFALLNAFLVLKFNINIYCRLNNFYKRTSKNDLRHKRDKFIESGGTKYNFNEVSGYYGVPRNKSFYALVEQQAKNIYLNIKSDGLWT